MSLETITYKDTIIFKPAITSGKVIKVYDGDTITIATKMPYDNTVMKPGKFGIFSRIVIISFLLPFFFKF